MGGEYVVTKGEEAAYVVTIKPAGGNDGNSVPEVYTNSKVSMKDIVKKEVVKDWSSVVYGRYGCGCVKEEGKNLCKKHARV